MILNIRGHDNVMIEGDGFNLCIRHIGKVVLIRVVPDKRDCLVDNIELRSGEACLTVRNDSPP